MKKIVVAFALSLTLGLSCMPTQKAHAFVITWVIQQAIKKVVKAVDLAIQRVQTKTIKLQAAQRELENILSKAQLDKIAGWNDSSRAVYTRYFNELASVKNVITYLHKVEEIVAVQKNILKDYQAGYKLFTTTGVFTADQAATMLQVYSGIASESMKNLDELTVVITPGKTKMTDGARLKLISEVYEKMIRNEDDLRRYNSENAQHYLQLTKSQADVNMIKRLYGL